MEAYHVQNMLDTRVMCTSKNLSHILVSCPYGVAMFLQHSSSLLSSGSPLRANSIIVIFMCLLGHVTSMCLLDNLDPWRISSSV